ncbi:fatty acid desaturase [Lysinibacillus sp. KCTC 33748]|uniref:fatty acid desaturase n=1 Tax=unclassified Lysinibacillus TaxID=2636778 RepID=UPI0009A58E72|nr:MULTISPECIES: fatty acid desaturase [unclassified Lysinibacillus]OXS67445.1 fatty acid desaturase [Lysinibacillus sp. KCTC 33748]SKC15275.1 omega-6 fatty acid desaturase (delta-12 desaturase) [Lysinibacillus sp. AC-3]
MATDKEKTKKLRQDVAPFAKSDTAKSIFQMVNTIIPLIALWVAGYMLVDVSPWLTVGLSVISAGFVVRTFIIFHDCTHGSFFKSKKANDWVGFVTGVLTSFPYEKWKREHTIHHATSSNLDKRGIGDIDMMTVEEFIQASKGQRLWYRFYRNPFVMFGLGPLFMVLILNRRNRNDAKQKERINTYLTNVAIVGICAALIFFMGWQAFLLVHVVTLFVAASLGIWLFFIQHTYEDSYFEHDSEWDYVKAAVEGSSYYKLPKLLQWVTGNIGFHHVHHLAPRVPNYNLEKAHNDIPPLHTATTITLRTSLESLRYKLYDEEQGKFVTFKDVNEIIKRKERGSLAA